MSNHAQFFEQSKTKAQAKGMAAAVIDILNYYQINSELIAIGPKGLDDPKRLVLTTEGDFGKAKPQIIRVPENLFEFPMEMVVNMLAHETYHVAQKTADNPLLDKNEREFQAYYEGVFPEKFAHLPPCPLWLKKQLAQQALRYFAMMQPYSVMYFNYLSQKYRLEEFLESLPA